MSDASLLLGPAPIQEQGLGALDGTLQRIDYKHRKIMLVAAGTSWHFDVPVDCDLRFDDQSCMLRCFHPLDHVHVIYDGEIVTAMYGWEEPV